MGDDGVLGRYATVDPRIINVKVEIIILTDERLPREKEHVFTRCRRITKERPRMRSATGNQKQAMTITRRTRTHTFTLPLIHINHTIRIFRNERLRRFKEHPITTNRQITRKMRRPFRAS
jgi:hypothetical protein